MAYDHDLDARVAALLAGRDGLAAKGMFGGRCYLCHGNMALGLLGADLIVRLPPADYAQALTELGVRPFDITGKPMKNWVMVDPDGTTEPDGLREWVERGWKFAQGLPPK